MAFEKLKGAIFGSSKVKIKAGRPEWEARIRPTMMLMSPISRTTYEVKWIGGERTCDKKLGVFTFPRINGEVVQDLSMNSDRYPLTFFFDGPKHDIMARDFWRKCKEVGRWMVWHPVHGLLYLQLTSVTQKDSPVDGANITEFNSEWMDPINPETLMTGTERMTDPYDLDSDAAEEFESSYSSKPGALGALKNAVKKIQDAQAKVFGPLMELNEIAMSSMLTLNSTIDGLMNSTAMNVLSLAGAVQQTMALPGKMIEDKVALMDSYMDMAQQIFGGHSTDLKVGRPSPASNNVALVKGLYACAIMSGAASAAISAGGGSGGGRGTGDAHLRLAELFQYLIDSSEADQTRTSTARRFADNYVAFQRTYSTARRLGFVAVRRLMAVEMQTPIEATFTTSVPVSPFVVSATEYGASEDSFERFVVQNDLKGMDILMLEANRKYKVTVDA